MSGEQSPERGAAGGSGLIVIGDIAAALQDPAAASPGLRTLGLTGNKAMPGTATLDQIAAPAADVSANSHKLTNVAAPTAASDAARKDTAEFAGINIGPNTYAYPAHPCMMNSTGSAMANANDYRWTRVVMPKTGTLRDVSCLVVTQSGNGNVLVLDDGQANATHTVRTVLAAKGATACPAGGQYFGFDPSLAVVAGDTLVFACTFDNTTAKVLTNVGSAGSGTLPSSSFYPGSGASTANQKTTGTCLAANLTATVSSTVTDANMVAGNTPVGFVFRIT